MESDIFCNKKTLFFFKKQKVGKTLKRLAVSLQLFILTQIYLDNH